MLPLKNNDKFLMEMEDNNKTKICPCCGQRMNFVVKVGNKLFLGLFCWKGQRFFIGKAKVLETYCFKMKDEVNKQVFNNAFSIK